MKFKSCGKKNIINTEEERYKKNKYQNIDAIVKNRSKKKYPCKRNKGEHIFKKISDNDLKWVFHGSSELYKCEKCGKLKYIFKKSQTS